MTKLDSRKIVRASITEMPKSFWDPLPSVIVTLDTDECVKLFDYFPDELSFIPAEFINLTLAEARQLKGRKDRAFLRS